jgi:hypothetical protein
MEFVVSEVGIGMNPAYNPYPAERRYPGACSWVLRSFTAIQDFYLDLG